MAAKQMRNSKLKKKTFSGNNHALHTQTHSHINKHTYINTYKHIFIPTLFLLHFIYGDVYLFVCILCWFENGLKLNEKKSPVNCIMHSKLCALSKTSRKKSQTNKWNFAQSHFSENVCYAALCHSIRANVSGKTWPDTCAN